MGDAPRGLAVDPTLAGFGVEGANPEDIRAALHLLDRADRGTLLAVGLDRLPDDASLWHEAGHVLCEAEMWRPAAVAYETSIRVALGQSGIANGRDIATALREAAVRSSDAQPDTAHRRHTGPWGRRHGAGPAHASLVNLAILTRDLEDRGAARDVVLRYAWSVEPQDAVIALLEIGCGADALPIVLRAPNPLVLCRLYLALGRPVEAIAAARLLGLPDEDVAYTLDGVLGSCGLSKYRRIRVGPWMGLIPVPDLDGIRAAAIDALAATCQPSEEERRQAATLLETLIVGDVAQAAAARNAVRLLGPSITPILAAGLRTGSDRLRKRIHDVVEAWAWQAAEERLMAATGLRRQPPRDMAGPPANETWSTLQRAVHAARELLLADAVSDMREFLRRCEHDPATAGHSDAVLELAERLLLEGYDAEARRLVTATATGGMRVTSRDVLRRVFAADPPAAFTFVLRHHARHSWITFASLGLPDDMVRGFAVEHLAGGRLSLEDSQWVVSLLRRAAPREVLRAALRRFPGDPLLLAVGGYALIERHRPRAARRMLMRSAARDAVADHRTGSDGLPGNALALLAGYPPADTTPEALRRSVGPWWPRLVNLAVLMHQQDGQAAARELIRSHETSGHPAEVAAALRAIGDVTGARTLLEAAVRGGDARAQDGLIAVYAGEDRLEEAVAVARAADRQSGLERVDMLLLGAILLEGGDNPPDDTLAYEARFDLARATERVIAALCAEQQPTADERERAERLTDELPAPEPVRRRRALGGLAALGPRVCGVLASFLARQRPAGDDTARRGARALLEEWAWDAAVARRSIQR